MNTVNIVMVGPQSVGKTSLLAGMYREMKDEVDDLDCILWQDAPTAGYLNQRRDELKDLATGDGKRVTGEVGIQKTASERSFTFGFVLNGNKAPTLSLCFTDLPGTFYFGQDSIGSKQADGHLAGSAFSLIAIDATALMEQRGAAGPGRFNSQINAPSVIHQCYLRSMQCLKDNKHHVLFVLIRAESYTDPQDRKLMFSLLREANEDLISDFKKHGIQAAATAVETVGGVRFHSFVVIKNPATDGDSATAKFIRKRGHKYEPKDCGVPFRWILHIAADRALANKKAGFFGWLRDLFGGNAKLAKAVLKLSDNVSVEALT